NENVIPFQPSADRFEHADLERGKNEIFADQLLPFALQEMMVRDHDRNEKMCFEHTYPRAKSVVETITPRLDPKHDPNNGEVKKEDEVGYSGVGKSDRDNRGRASD